MDDAAVAEHENPLKMSHAGAIPPVASMGEMAALSASDKAYGTHAAPERELSPGGEIMEREVELDGKTIEEASRRYGIREVDILAIITQESRGDADANAGASQKDKGKNAASGLMQVTRATWDQTIKNHPELAKYGFWTHRYDRRANILVGTAALADKKDALERLGVPGNVGNSAALLTMAYNAGEGIVAEAYERARDAGVEHPDEACLRAEYLKPAIAKYPSVYSYYLTGGGKGKNPKRSKQRAIDLKFQEISKYPSAVEMLVAEAEEHDLATTTEEDMPLQSPVMTAEAEGERERERQA